MTPSILAASKTVKSIGRSVPSSSIKIWIISSAVADLFSMNEICLQISKKFIQNSSFYLSGDVFAEEFATVIAGTEDLWGFILSGSSGSKGGDGGFEGRVVLKID